MIDLVIRDCVIVSSAGRIEGDIAVDGGKIVGVGNISGAARATVDAKGMVAIPGLIDTQVHFREPGLTQKEDLESGTRAAVAGGVTTIFEMPNTVPNTITAEALQDKLSRSVGRCWSDYSYFIGASLTNIEQLGELEMLPGTPGVKIFAGSSTGDLLVESEDDLRRVLQNGVRPCPIHSEFEPRLRERKSMLPENPDVSLHPWARDPEAARISTERMIRLSEETGRPVHILHISTADELPLLRDAKDRGLKVTCEGTPQHLTLEASLYETLGTLLQMNPPIRDESHRAAIFQAFKDDLFDVIGSDHAPHTLEEKALPYPQSPSGMPGVQTMLPVFLRWVQKGETTLENIVRLGCENPCKLYGIANKGYLREGFDADIVLLRPDESFLVEKDWLQSKCGWSPYEGWTLWGKPQHVFVGGNQVVRDANISGQPAGRPAVFDWK